MSLLGETTSHTKIIMSHKCVCWYVFVYLGITRAHTITKTHTHTHTPVNIFHMTTCSTMWFTYRLNSFSWTTSNCFCSWLFLLITSCFWSSNILIWPDNILTWLAKSSFCLCMTHISEGLDKVVHNIILFDSVIHDIIFLINVVHNTVLLDDEWLLMFYCHVCVHGRLNGSSDLQRQWSNVKDETSFRYAHTEIWTQVVVICDPTHYQLDQGGTLYNSVR